MSILIRGVIMYETSMDTALLLAVMLRRSKKTRGRVSEKTIKFVSRRERLKGAFLADLRGELEELGVMMVPLDRGGYALVAMSALEGAPTILARDFIIDEVRSMHGSSLNRAALWKELGFEKEADTD